MIVSRSLNFWPLATCYLYSTPAPITILTLTIVNRKKNCTAIITEQCMPCFSPAKQRRYKNERKKNEHNESYYRYLSEKQSTVIKVKRKKSGRGGGVPLHA
jgi:hypothetical protein